MLLVLLAAPLVIGLLSTWLLFQFGDGIRRRVGHGHAREMLWVTGGATAVTSGLATWLIAFVSSRPTSMMGSDTCPDWSQGGPSVYALIGWILVANGATAAVAGWSAEGRQRGWALLFAIGALLITLFASYVGLAARLCDPS